MALVSLRQLLDRAAENGYGAPAFNANNLEQRRVVEAKGDLTSLLNDNEVAHIASYHEASERTCSPFSQATAIHHD